MITYYSNRESFFMYMNKSKRYLIMSAAIINLIQTTISLVLSILMLVNEDLLAGYQEYYFVVSMSYNIFYTVFSFVVGVVGSSLLLYSIRKKGKFFRSSQTPYFIGVIIVVFCGGWISWLLLLIEMLIPDIIIINSKSELRHEEKEQAAFEKQQSEAYEAKKQKIEELKKMRDDGVITEEEYKKKLFELL